MNNGPNETRNEVDEFVKKAFDSKIPEDLEARMHAQLISFRRDLLARRTSALRWRPRLLRVATAMACAFVLIVSIEHFLYSGMPPTWAEVGARFASVPFFGATVYVKNGAMSEPVQFDLWMNQGGLLRMRAGNQVMFGKGGHITESVKLAGPDTPVEATEYGRELIESMAKSLASAEAFSFDTFVRALPGKTIVSLPSYNEEASVAKDLVVYDIVNQERPDWIRIWALRESKLPIHVLFWSPEDGYSVDAVLVYSNQQPVEFFNPDRFKESLTASSDATGQAYLLLKDPG
ncbi:MAG: hypothetical protein NTU83_05010, partial [Candidatus Hydrogenedentes bacterium]|nr:hypothetical protein [Candidatus Hydrogenedentota bacterium]